MNPRGTVSLTLRSPPSLRQQPRGCPLFHPPPPPGPRPGGSAHLAPRQRMRVIASQNSKSLLGCSGAAAPSFMGQRISEPSACPVRKPRPSGSQQALVAWRVRV